jgi:Rrf2 family protein
MQQLVHAGILKSIRGPRGGYTLARERRRISIGEIVRIIADMDPETEELPPGSALAVQVVRPLWDSLCDEMWQRLDSVTIDDLCQRARAARIGVESNERADFAI